MLDHAEEAYIQEEPRADLVDADDGLKERFDAGDFTGVARVGPEDDWRTHAARGLIGLRDRAVAGLQRFDRPEARFYSAVADWIDGRNDDAARGLEGIDLPHARNLLALLRKPRIEVLALMPSNRPFSLLQGITKDPTFSVRNLGFNAQDIPLYPYADIHRYYDRSAPPDFFLCTKPEWYAIPPQIQELPCPLIGQTADWDMLAQTTQPRLRLFDEIVMTGSDEHRNLVKLVDAPVTTFPKPNGVPTSFLPEVPSPDQTRTTDLVMTGSTVFPYYKDKAKLLAMLRQIDGLKTLYVNGFVGGHSYWDLYARSLMCLSYTRNPDAFPTRALESLAMGCVSLVQRKNTLDFYLGEDEGMVFYDFDDPKSLIDATRRVLADPAKYLARAYRGSQIVREQLSETRAASQMFRFATFIAARPRQKRRKALIAEEQLQKRYTIFKGWFPASGQFQEMLDNKTRVRLITKLFDAPTEEVSAATFNDMARDLMIQFVCQVHGAHHLSPHAEEYLNKALKIYRAGLERFPNSLILRFNFVRACLHFGRLTDVEDGVRIATDTVDGPVNKWSLEVEDDVLPWDYLNEVFDFRAYIDAYVRMKQGDGSAIMDMKRLIISALYFGLSQILDNLEYLDRCVELSPDFFWYRLVLAKKLLRTGDAKNARRAVEIARDLAESSDRFVNATQLLRIAKALGVKDVGDLETYEYRVRDAARRYFLFENSGIQINSYYYRAMNFNRTELRTESVFRATYAPKAPKVSIVLVHEPGYNSSEAVASLTRQDLPRHKYEIIWVEPFDVLYPIQELVDVMVSRRQTISMYHKFDCYNGGLISAKGSIIVFCEAVTEFPKDFVSKIVSALKTTKSGRKDRPRIAVMANHGAVSQDGAGSEASSPPLGAITNYIQARDVIGSCLAVHRDDALNLMGYDTHLGFVGAFGAPVDLARRMSNTGLEMVEWKSAAAYPNVKYFGAVRRYEEGLIRDCFEEHFQYQAVTPMVGSHEVADRRAHLDREQMGSLGFRMP